MHDHRRRTSTEKARLARRLVVLSGLLVCLLLIAAAPASADVMAKYRTAYKNKLTHYRNLMDGENTFLTAWTQAAESTSNLLAAALADPDHPENIGIVKQVAVQEGSELRDAVTTSRDRTYASIAAFRAKAVNWFRTTADKSRFKARLAIMKSGFKQMYSADEDLMSAYYYLGVNADVPTANNEIMASGLTSLTAEDLFEKGLQQLRALQ